MFDAMRKLYHAGVDCGLETFQGAGVIAWIVDGTNHRLEKQFTIEELDTIPGWFFAEAIRLHYSNPEAIERTPRDLLSELASGARKEPRRVSPHERDERRGLGGATDQRSA
jgi:hypothetical protein